jgi:uncharacterized protein (TIGR00369 family)
MTMSATWSEELRAGLAAPPMSHDDITAQSISERLAGVRMSCPPVSGATGTMDAVQGRAPLLSELGVLADATCGNSILRDLPRTFGCRTVDLRMDATEALSVHRGPVAARGEVLHLGSRFALCRSVVHDAQDQPLAHFVGQFVIVPDAPRVPGLARGEAGSDRRLDPLSAILDVYRLEPQDGRLRVRFDPRSGNEFGVLHGGLYPVVIETTLAEAVAAAGGTAMLDLAAVLHRPVVPQAGEFVLDAHVERAGRRVVAAAGELREPGGRLLASYSGRFAGSS